MKNSIKIDIGNSMLETEIEMADDAVLMFSNSALKSRVAKRITEALQKIIMEEVMKLKRTEEQDNQITNNTDERIYYMDI